LAKIVCPDLTENVPDVGVSPKVKIPRRDADIRQRADDVQRGAQIDVAGGSIRADDQAGEG